MDNKGTLYFFTGLSGAGKTTIGGRFYELLKQTRPDAVLYDGDQLRTAAGHKDYSTASRLAGAKIMIPICKVQTDAGRDVVWCTISMYDEVRELNRKNFENYREIYVKASMETLYRRDQKGLYSSGEKNVVGVDLPWDEPKRPDVVIENDGGESPEEIVSRLAQRFGVAEG